MAAGAVPCCGVLMARDLQRRHRLVGALILQ